VTAKATHEISRTSHKKTEMPHYCAVANGSVEVVLWETNIRNLLSVLRLQFHFRPIANYAIMPRTWKPRYSGI
jgi:hypothetical protein